MTNIKRGTRCLQHDDYTIVACKMNLNAVKYRLWQTNQRNDIQDNVKEKDEQVSNWQSKQLSPAIIAVCVICRTECANIAGFTKNSKF